MSWKSRGTFLKAQKLMESNDLEGAERLFTEYLDANADADAIEARLHRGFIRIRMNRLEEALADANACVQARPDSGVAHMLQGEVYLKKSDYMSAYQALQQATRLEKDNGRAFYYLGKATQELSRPEEAADYYEMALQLEPAFVWAHSFAK